MKLQPGEVHGFLEFLRPVKPQPGDPIGTNGEFKCVCGAIVRRARDRVFRGHVKSCGCKRHGSPRPTIRTANGEGCKTRRSKTYRTWKKLFEKCYHKQHRDYHSFGAKGITVCDRWRDYKAFIADVGHLPSAMFQFRLFENSTEYAPGKAGWVFSSAGKSHNQRVITIDGKSDILANWLVHYNVKRQTFWYRVSRGMSEIEALTKNFHIGGGYFEF